VVVADPAVGTTVTRRNAWSLATLAGTIVPIVLAVATAPDAGAKPVRALAWLLFVGSSVHVGATGWFYTVPEVRTHMSRHRTRYIWTPVALIAGLAVIAAAATSSQLAWVLLAFYAWQFIHFQKQNLGMAALAARAHGGGALSRLERRALVIAGVGGVLGLVGHPTLLLVPHVHRLDWLFAVGAGVFALGSVLGIRGLVLREPSDRPRVFAFVYLVSLLFFAPVWMFDSPYAAVAGLTIAHGLQYLLLVGLVAVGPTRGSASRFGLLVLVNVALFLGLALNRMSHLHDAPAVGRLLFGAYLGMSTAHFVIDAALWRLRDEFPREFLTRRLPYLLAAQRI
jgi:hypothetical protein